MLGALCDRTLTTQSSRMAGIGEFVDRWQPIAAASSVRGATNTKYITNGLLFKIQLLAEDLRRPQGHTKVCDGTKLVQNSAASRSYSISGQMHGGDSVGTPLILGGNPGWAKAHKKVSSIDKPGPSQAFVFVDESEWTLDDGYFAVLVNADTWQTIRRCVTTRAPDFPLRMGTARSGA